MGLLDDAIREHLDLKRRRGADPTEVERAEREALGPVRRGPEGAEPEEFLPALESDEPVGYEPIHEQGWQEPLPAQPEPFAEPFHEAVHEPLPLHDPPLSHEASAYEEPSAYGNPPAYEEPPVYQDHVLGADPPTVYHEPAPPTYHEPESPLPEEPVSRDPAEPALPHPEGASPHPAGGETVEYDVHQEVGKEGEDVLEETPEFLQDAPEHDRLWFEQRPPRDFDFNE